MGRDTLKTLQHENTELRRRLEEAEQAIEAIRADEVVEVTPAAFRLRKKVLQAVWRR